jgi:hypothetical protein
MKKFLPVSLIVLLALQIVSCKTVFEITVKPVIDVITNQELVALQIALQISKKDKGKWPADLPELFTNIENDSLKGALGKFSFLEWNQEGDSLLVSYRLNYAETDSTALKFLAGKFYLQPSLDTLKSRHFQIEGETKTGLQIFPSSHMEQKVIIEAQKANND